MLPFCCAPLPRSSRAPPWAIACTPKLFAGIAAVMKRDGGAWNVTLPASTRRRISSSSPSYQTCRLLLASNSRWLSKSTSTCSRWPTMPPVRIAYCGFGVIVGNPALHPDNVACCSCDVQRRLRNWSALSSSRRLRFMPSSAGLGGEGAVTTGDRKSTRLNSSHSQISYAVFCLKKKKKMLSHAQRPLASRANYEVQHYVEHEP